MYYTIHLFIMYIVCLLHLECEFLQDKGFFPPIFFTDALPMSIIVSGT